MSIDNKLDDIEKQFSQPLQIKTEDIPKLDLYMDQLVTYLDDNLSPMHKNEDGLFVTKTMVNNYTKLKLLPPANKKKYSGEHLRILSMIVQLKKMLSMNDIAKITQQIQPGDHDIYDSFLQAQCTAFENLPQTFAEATKCCTGKDSEKKALAMVALHFLAEAQSRTLVAQQILGLIEPEEKTVKAGKRSDEDEKKTVGKT